MIVEAMFDFLPVHIYGIVVVLGVHDKATPFPPSWGNIGAVVFVQVFPKVA